MMDIVRRTRAAARAAVRALKRFALAAYRLADRAWPLSAFGTATLALAVLMWVRSSAEENNAGLAFPIFLAFVVFASVVATRAWNAAPWVSRCSWERVDPLRQGENPRAFRVSAPADRAPFPFLRVHFAVSGSLSSASCATFRVALERRAVAGETVEVAMALPASGELSLRAGFVVRDALGLTRRRVGARQSIDEAALPAMGQEFSVVEPDASASSERNAISKKTEGEKIFIREYVPGDLARDVNWKALARTGLLLTRVPPESPKETRVIRVALLPPARGRDPFARGRALVSLDHLRTLVSSFLVAVREFSPDYAFALTVGDRECFVDSGDSLDGLFAALSLAGFAGDPVVSGDPASQSTRGTPPAVPEGAWVFASASDPASRAMLTQCASAGCQLVVSVGPCTRPQVARPSADQPSVARSEENPPAGGSWRILSLSSSIPFAFPLPSMLASLVPSRAAKGDEERLRLPGTALAEFHCGVRA